MPVKRSNPGIYKTITTRLDALAGLEGKVGWFPGSKYENGTPVAFVAMLNEMGKHARPFIRPTIASKEKSWINIAKRGSLAVIKHGEQPEKVLELVAQEAESDIAETITKTVSPPLSPITILLRYWRRQGRKITGATVGEAAIAVKQPGYVEPDVTKKPLEDSTKMFTELTHAVEKS